MLENNAPRALSCLIACRRNTPACGPVPAGMVHMAGYRGDRGGGGGGVIRSLSIPTAAECKSHHGHMLEHPAYRSRNYSSMSPTKRCVFNNSNEQVRWCLQTTAYVPAVQRAAARAAAHQAKGRPKGKGKRKAESDAESGGQVEGFYMLPCRNCDTVEVGARRVQGGTTKHVISTVRHARNLPA